MNLKILFTKQHSTLLNGKVFFQAFILRGPSCMKLWFTHLVPVSLNWKKARFPRVPLSRQWRPSSLTLMSKLKNKTKYDKRKSDTKNR